MITKPTLILDEAKCRKNIEAMARKARLNNVQFRPHFKTHQSLEIGNWFKERGVREITVSSLDMAKYFSLAWNNITLAFPVNILEIDDINALAAKIRLNLLVESEEVALFLSENLRSPAGCFIKIDTGYHRTGVQPENVKLIDAITRILENSETLNFMGFLTHAGQTYGCQSKSEVQSIFSQSAGLLKQLKYKYSNQFPGLMISVGDTPGCSIAKDFENVDEIRPGNFVFYDLMQFHLGSCAFSEIAVTLACPVVAVHRQRNEVVIHGGAVHFSKESLFIEGLGEIFGQVVSINGNTWCQPMEGLVLRKLSQEHGVVSIQEKYSHKISPGDVLSIIPVHSCLTANLMKTYQTLKNKGINTIHTCVD